MIRAIIFDCFGVLVGHGFWDTYKAVGGDPVKDRAFIEEMLHKASAGTVSNELFAALMADRLGLSVAEYIAAVNRQERVNTQLFAYIRTKLKPAYKLAVVSNANAGVLERRIPAEHLKMFDVVIASAEVGLMKPDPAIFKLAIDKLGTIYEETVFIDDLEHYTAPASRLGLHTIQYKGLDDLRLRLEPLLANKT
ncbi:MAG TPA: HAD-IA family hydrolase [Candidatus Saccharimonadales bacterium]|nr:HAD-IA family hydrolase [Candidatus Saccharimonadales bacterium]